MFQDSSSALDPRMNVGDSIREPMELAAEGDPVIRHRRMLDLLDRVGLSAATAGRYPHELSGGQKKRVNIARALAQNPTLIVCDEVGSADASIQADILNLFADLQSQFGLTYVFITHDLGVVAHVSTRIAVMYLGRIVELGPAGPVTEAPLHPYTQALLAAEPVALPAALRPAKRLRLQGEVPSPIAPPSGCHFRTRCPYADARCAEETPSLRIVSNERSVACHYVAEVPASNRTASAMATS